MQEHRVVLDRGVVGLLTLPDDPPPHPAVLLLHGFGNHKDEVGDLFRRLALMLAAAQMASLRIDFRGWGESAGDMADTTIAGQWEDAQLAGLYVNALPTVDASRLGIVGFSLGSASAILCAAEASPSYAALVLWSPALDHAADAVAAFGQETLDQAVREGIVTIDLGWRCVTLKDTFFRGLGTHDLHAQLQRYPGSVLVVAGSADESATVVPDVLATTPGQVKETIIIDGADHIFNVLDDDQTAATQLLEATVQWLRATLEIGEDRKSGFLSTRQCHQ
jgi:uncharacterized protein